MPIEAHFPVGRMSVSIHAEDVKDLIEQVSFLNALPENCPICGANIAFFYRTPQKYRYYGILCDGDAEGKRHKANFGQHKETFELFYRGTESWSEDQYGGDTDRSENTTESEPEEVTSCQECGKELTRNQHKVSMAKFQIPLCPEHQKAAEGKGKPGSEKTPKPTTAGTPASDGEKKMALEWVAYADSLKKLKPGEEGAFIKEIHSTDAPLSQDRADEICKTLSKRCPD